MTRRKRYSAEFKREALRRANEEGATDTLVCERSDAAALVGAVAKGLFLAPTAGAPEIILALADLDRERRRLRHYRFGHVFSFPWPSACTR